MAAAHERALEWRRSIRRHEYERMVEAGVFDGVHVELLYGVIVEMSPHGPTHDGPLTRLARLLTLAAGAEVDVRVQCAFAATDGSEPEPDIAVVPRAKDDSAHPTRAHLVVEVAVSSLERDRTAKAQLYAECGVPEYWIVNVVDRQIEVLTQPSSAGYARSAIHRSGARLLASSLANVEIAVDEVLL